MTSWHEYVCVKVPEDSVGVGDGYALLHVNAAFRDGLAAEGFRLARLEEEPPRIVQVGWTWDSRDGSGAWHVWPLEVGEYPGAEPCYRLVPTDEGQE